MKLKVKIKSIYRRYKKYTSVWCIFTNLLCAAIPPYINLGTYYCLLVAAVFGLVLYQERKADVFRRTAKLIAHKAKRIVEELYDELHIYRQVEAKRKFYSAFRFSAGDQFYYDGKWHNVASVKFQEDLIAYDISTDEDDDLQLVWVRFENIESYKSHYEETNANT